MMQVNCFGRWSIILVLAYTPSADQDSTTALKPPGAYIKSGGPEPAISYRVAMPSTVMLGMVSP
jgi:hypothetical protein